MEALTAVSVAALALVDMVKAIDPEAVITGIQVEEKTGGKTGAWRRSSRGEPAGPAGAGGAAGTGAVPGAAG
jgi:cyclic pyranopterin phosphate synthase